MNKLALALLINMGIFAFYTIVLIILTGEDFNHDLELFFMGIVHAAVTFITGIIIVIVQGARQKEVLFGIGCIIAAPLVFVIGFASCFLNNSMML